MEERRQSGRGNRALFNLLMSLLPSTVKKKNKMERSMMVTGWPSAGNDASLLCWWPSVKLEAPFHTYNLCSPYLKLFPKTMHKNMNSYFLVSFQVAGEPGPKETLGLHSSWLLGGAIHDPFPAPWLLWARKTEKGL